MKVKITGSPITMYGNFSPGQVLSSPRYPIGFLMHLVNDCHVATDETKIEIEAEQQNKMNDDVQTKHLDDYQPIKKNPSLPLLEQGGVSTKKTAKKHSRKHKS